MSTWYEDSILLLEEAEEILEQIKQIEIDSVKDSDKLRKAKPKIKNFLDNCRAPLDYLAVYLRDTYTNSKQKVYFPFAYNQQTFERRIKSDFKNKLPKHILNSIASTMPFYENSKSFYLLNKLTNENKHQKLSYKTEVLERKVNYMSLPGDNVFSNITFIGNGVPVTIGDTEYDLINTFPNDDDSGISSKFILIFEEYDAEVVDFLSDILFKTKKVIEDIHQFTID